MAERTIAERRAIVCAPHGRDGALIASNLAEEGIPSHIVPEFSELAEEFKKGAGCIVVTEEALHGSISQLLAEMSEQPPWSDLPIIILTTGGTTKSERTWYLVKELDAIGNVTLLERPLRKITLVHAVHVALRSRMRQYEMRTFQENLEKRVAERTAELERLNAEAEGFCYTIAHDLRSPLRAIIGACRVMRDDFGNELSPNALHQLDSQATFARRLATLIDDLLRLSKLAREQMCFKEIDLTQMARDLTKELSSRDEYPGCKVEVQENLKAKADPTLLRLALANLIQNACKFSPKGGQIVVGRDESSFFVKDEGIGFDQEYAHKMFLPFERLVREDEFPGTGIGLANVKRIMERHGGKVWATGEVGKGAEFHFTLPVPVETGPESRASLH